MMRCTRDGRARNAVLHIEHPDAFTSLFSVIQLGIGEGANILVLCLCKTVGMNSWHHRTVLTCDVYCTWYYHFQGTCLVNKLGGDAASLSAVESHKILYLEYLSGYC